MKFYINTKNLCNSDTLKFAINFSLAMAKKNSLNLTLCLSAYKQINQSIFREHLPLHLIKLLAKNREAIYKDVKVSITTPKTIKNIFEPELILAIWLQDLNLQKIDKYSEDASVIALGFAKVIPNKWINLHHAIEIKPESRQIKTVNYGTSNQQPH